MSDISSILVGKEKLQINSSVHNRTWGFYALQYNTVFNVFLNIAKECHYQTNCKFMSFMFILRHALELLLKKICSEKGLSPLHYSGTHNIEELLELADLAVIKKSLEALKTNSEGDCWRYNISQNGYSCFEQAEVVNPFDACCCYIDLTNQHLGVKQDSIVEYVSNRIFRHEINFYMSECSNLAQAANQYDYAIRDLLLAINNGQIKVDEIYLPLFFLIRHTLELKLKQSILNIGNVVEEDKRKLIFNCHSVAKLYDILSVHIDEAINAITDKKLKEDSERFQGATARFKDVIQKLDANSMAFRFPVTKKGKKSNFVPSKNDLYETLLLYQQSDSFLCFAIEVLLEAGVLEIGDDILHSLYY